MNNASILNGCSLPRTLQVIAVTGSPSDKEKKELGIPFDDYPMWPNMLLDKWVSKDVNLAKNGVNQNQNNLRTSLSKKTLLIMHLDRSVGVIIWMKKLFSTILLELFILLEQ